LLFFCGTLGFLTPFCVTEFKEVLNSIIEGNAVLILRSRLHCKLYREKTKAGRDGEDSSCLSIASREEFFVLNEAVVDRGSQPFLTEILCYCNDVQITTIRADGIIISSPTGSTGYALSAGASIVHPFVPGILFTPICPHSLSFRPVVFPDSVEIKLQVPSHARSSGWVSFDGRSRKRLDANESLIITTSPYPFPSVAKSSVIIEWFKDLANIFHWNDRPSH